MTTTRPRLATRSTTVCFPVVEVNRDGVVGVAWYDRRRDDTRRCWELFFTSSSDGGETFGRERPRGQRAVLSAAGARPRGARPQPRGRPRREGPDRGSRSRRWTWFSA